MYTATNTQRGCVLYNSVCVWVMYMCGGYLYKRLKRKWESYGNILSIIYIGVRV